MQVDLNCDLGESFGAWKMGMDDQVIPHVSSCNIACGMHAGDPVVMNATVKLAKQAGVAIGAHPGYPDLQGFGRRDLSLSADETYAYVLYQISALAGICTANGVEMSHVKPHGQLYNRSAVDTQIAGAVAKAVHDFNPNLVLVGLAGSVLLDEGKKLGLHTAGEFFTDRNYTDEGTLVSRRDPKALITDEEFAIERAIRAIQSGTIESVTGREISLQADTICVHGDNVHALEFVTRCRKALTAAGIDICPVR